MADADEKANRITDFYILDHNWGGPGLPMDDYIDCKFQFKRSAVGGAQGTMPYGSDASKRIVNDTYKDMVPVIATINGHRWEGWMGPGKVSGPYGNKVVEWAAVSVQTILNTILCYPKPWLPLGTQPDKWYYVGPAATGILNVIKENADRLALPMVVLPLKNDTDNSYLVNWAARMQSVEELTKNALVEMQEHLKVSMWLPGDPPLPGQHTIGLYPQTQNHTPFTPAGPVFVVEVIQPVTKVGVVFEEEEGKIEAEISWKQPEASEIISGGKTNDFIRTLLPALVNVFENWFFAYDFYITPNSSTWGNYRPRQLFFSSDQAYTLDSIMAARQHSVETQGSLSVTLTQTNLNAEDIGAQCWLGDIIGADVELKDEVVWDYISSIEVSANRESGLTLNTTIGDQRAAEDWLAKLVGRVQGLFKMINEIGKVA